jgi:hypothetical protein
MGSGVYWLTCALAVVCGITSLVIATRVTDGRWFIGGLGFTFLVSGLCMLVRPQTVVETDTHVVRRRLRLFGRFLVSSRNYAFSDFSAVVIRRVRGSNAGRDPDQFFVLLRRQSGRLVLVSYFEADIARKCLPAEELAQRLSADLQIELKERDG